jgi:hypothetical protein
MFYKLSVATAGIVSALVISSSAWADITGLSPVSAATYHYNVLFAIGLNTVTGTMVTDCNDCTPKPHDFVSWSFMLNGGDPISSSDLNARIKASGHPLPLSSMPEVGGSNMIFDPMASTSSSY